MHPEIVAAPTGPTFFWNLDGAVGRNGANLWDDVLFVTWCLYKFARLPQTPHDLRSALEAVGLTDNCDGSEDHPLVKGIYAVQRHFHLQPVDGKVSVARGLIYTNHYDERAYLIFRLNAVLRMAHPDKYPRLDLMPQFAWPLGKLVKPVFV